MVSGILALLLAAGLAQVAQDDPPHPTPEQIVREVSAEVEVIRGLRFRRPVKMELVDGARAREIFGAKIEPWEIAAARHTQRAYRQLGLVPEGTDLVANALDLAEKELLGFYSPGSETFYLLDRVPEADARMVMAHELTHALEDQHFDLETLRRRAAVNADRLTALTSVIEGSATGVSVAYASRRQDRWAAVRASERNARRIKRYAAAPSFVQRSLVMPYTLGLTFLRRGSPWRWHTDGGIRHADIDRAYAAPPSSTRQILHPETYWSRRLGGPARDLAIPDLSKVLGPGWSRAAEGSIGELGLAVLTGAAVNLHSSESRLPARWTNEAAAGCVGDAYTHYVNAEAAVTVLMTRWETERDAEQFELAMRQTRGLTVVRFGVNFVVLAGDVGDRAQALAAEAMKSMNYWVD